MEIQVTHSASPATSQAVPEFPLVRFDTGLVVYQEALINGQYLVANASAMGRPKPREWVWSAFNGGQDATRPLRTRQHAFQIEADGQLLVDRWEWVEAREEEAPRPGCRASVVVLRHTQRPVTVEVHTRLDDTAFIARWLVIANAGERPMALAQVFPWSGQVWEPVGRPWLTAELSSLPGAPFSLGRFTESSWGVEGAFDWQPLPDGRYGFESQQGVSGWGAPFFMARNEVTGEVMVGQFAWSGNWQIEFFSDHQPARRPVCDARLYARIGMAGPAPLRVLEPGETARTPEVHLGFLFGGLDECVQALHTHERRSVVLPQPAGREHRVEVNHTGYTRNLQVTEGQLHEDIDIAADAGVELFLLDAGWFGDASEQWWDVMGDWDRESPLIPSGVKAIFDYARSKGMLCGLWAPPEPMGKASHLLRDHADWQMVKRGEKINNLDYSRPEVAEYVEKTVAGLIERYGLDCYRIDGGALTGDGPEAERGGYTENVLWRHWEAFYGIFERIHRRFPNVLLECCCGGGGHTDLGIMSRFHWTQTSDNWSPAPTLKIVNGLTMSLPPELCETLLGAISDGVSDVDFMLRIGLFGHFCVSGIAPTMGERQMAARERWRHHIQLYKDFVRPMLSSSRLYHHTPVQRQTEPGDWVVLECASEDASKGYAGIFRLGAAQGETYQFHPKGLDISRRYRVTYDNSGRTCEMDGAALANSGLRVAVPSALTSELLLFEAL